jgi:hypothetical protein
MSLKMSAKRAQIGAHRTGSYNATLREKEAGLSAIAHPERIVGQRPGSHAAAELQ